MPLSSRVSPGGPGGDQAGQHPPKLLKRGKGPRHPTTWDGGDIGARRWGTHRCSCPPCPSTPLQEELQASHTTYIRQHPELRALLTDFLRALLLRQPRDPVSFAAQFFAPFASAGAASPLPSPPPRHPPADGE